MECLKTSSCGCPFCALLPLELTCGVLRFVGPSNPKDLFRLAAVSPCFRSALKETRGLHIDLGHHQADRGLPLFLSSSQRTGELLYALATSFPQLSLVTFTASLSAINNYNSTDEWHAHWISPSLYGRLVMASLRGRWHDQGWGNQKGTLLFECEDRRGKGSSLHAAPGVAPHQEDHFETLVGREDWPNQPFIGGARFRGGEQEGFRLKLKYWVGGGGGHSLRVKDLTLTIGVSPHEWHLWLEEWISRKLAREEGWAWCIDGRHPSLLLFLASDGTARFEEWRGPKATESETEGIPPLVREQVLAHVRQEEANLLRSSGNGLEWSFHSVSGCVALRSKALGLDLLYLLFDQGYDEFYVCYPFAGGRGARGFPLDHGRPIKSAYRTHGFFPAIRDDLPRDKDLSLSTTDAMGRRLVLSGVEVFDPFETFRRYSSVWDRNPPGKGHAQSTLDSALAWCAQHNRPGEWLEMQVAPPQKNRTILGLVVQRREWEDARQCVQKLQVQFQKASEGLHRRDPAYLDYSPTFEIGFGKSFFSKPVRGRYFRIIPTRWRGHISMRAGLLVLGSDAADAAPGEVVLLNPPEGQRTYSSVWRNEPPGVGHARSMINSPQAWSSGKVDEHQWMIIDAGSIVTAAGVHIQFRADYAQAVHGWRVETKVCVQDEWQAIDQGAVFSEDPAEPRFLWFDAPIQANTIRITVLEWENHIALRCGVVLVPGATDQ